jgi:hypothetical protein
MSEYGDLGAVVGLLIFALLIVAWVKVGEWLARRNERTVNRPYDWERDA